MSQFSVSSLGGSGSGDVVGPASSTDNDLVVFDGLTGKIIKDTGISSIDPTFTGIVESEDRFVAPYDTGFFEGYYFSDGAKAAAVVGTATGNFMFAGAGNSNMTGIANSGFGLIALSQNTTGQINSAFGSGALQNNQSGSFNTSVGSLASRDAVSGDQNVTIGYASVANGTGYSNTVSVGAFALSNGLTGSNNVAVGNSALMNVTSGTTNTSVGNFSLNTISTGDNNIGVGYASGSSYTTSDSDNICIGNLGSPGGSGEIRIGGSPIHTTCYIAGIDGVTVTGTAVLCSTSGQLGTVSSSERYKENIIDMPENISVMNLRPVRFNYKSDKEKTYHYGLIAEEVHRDFPYLCHYNVSNEPESVKYHELCTFLLKEVQNLNKRIEALEAK